MDHPLAGVLGRVPAVITCLDSRGRPVSLPAATLSRWYTDLVELFRVFYATARPGPPGETVEVSFREETCGRIQVDFAVRDASRRPRLRPRRRDRCRAGEVQAALLRAAVLTTTAVETVAALLTAETVEIDESDPEVVGVRLDGRRCHRLPRVLVTTVRTERAAELLRGALWMFTVDAVAQLVIGKDPEAPGRYQEAVVSRSPQLVRFLGGAPLASLINVVPAPGGP